MVMWTIVQNDVLFLNKANCQSQCVIWTSCYSCIFEMSFTEAALSLSQGMNAAWQTCQMVSYQKSQRLKKLQQVVLFLDKFLTHWLKAAALKPPQFFQMPKRLTKAHTSVSQLATCGRLDQRFVKTPLKTFLLLMLHFKGFTCKPPRAVEATTGKCQVVFEQLSKHWVKMLHTRFWEWATNIGKLVEQVAHMLLLQRPGTTLGHFPASH